jgi:hypothetical protein
MTKVPELAGKLDAATPSATMALGETVNGPGDEVLD